MAFIRDIEDSLLTLLNTKLSIPVNIDYSPGPEPTGDYGVIGLTASDKLHRTTINTYSVDTIAKERIKQDYLLRFTLKFYGDSCYDNAFESQAILASRTVQEYLYENGQVSYADFTNIRRVPELRPTGYVQRAIYDIKLLAGYEYTSDADWFDEVEYPKGVIDAEPT